MWVSFIEIICLNTDNIQIIIGNLDKSTKIYNNNELKKRGGSEEGSEEGTEEGRGGEKRRKKLP